MCYNLGVQINAVSMDELPSIQCYQGFSKSTIAEFRCLAHGLLQEVAEKRKFHTLSYRSVRDPFQEVEAYKRLQI